MASNYKVSILLPTIYIKFAPMQIFLISGVYVIISQHLKPLFYDLLRLIILFFHSLVK